MPRSSRNNISKQEVLETILNKILYLDLKPGESILDTKLAEELSVGRTPVREALLFLKQLKFIDIYPQSGTFVSLIDVELIKEIIYIRHILEYEIFNELFKSKTEIRNKVERYIILQDLAVRENNQKDYVKNDHLFHKELFSLAGHERSWDLIQNQYLHTTRFHMLDFYSSKTVFSTSLQEHKDILDCYEKGNIDEVKKILDVHHDCNLRTANTLKEKYPNYFV